MKSLGNFAIGLMLVSGMFLNACSGQSSGEDEKGKKEQTVGSEKASDGSEKTSDGSGTDSEHPGAKVGSDHTSENKQPAAEGPLNISTQQLSEQINQQSDLQILDVRTPKEVAAGVIQGARVANVLEADFLEKVSALNLDKEKDIVVYCKMGGRSSRAQKILLENGFRTVHNLEGGITGWNQAGLPLEKR